MESTSNPPIVEILDGAVVQVREDLDKRLAAIHVEPKMGEDSDEKMPKNLHNAGELFLETGRTDAAQKMQQCAQVFFALVEGRCNSEASVKGQACICWACGHCGLERVDSKSLSNAGTRVQICNRCGESTQTNSLQVILADGLTIPWQEASADAGTPIISFGEQAFSSTAPDSEEYRQAKIKQEKRAAIAASVEAAREKQREPEVTPETDLPQIQMSDVSERLWSMQVIPIGNQGAHKSFPKNLYNAMELFTQLQQWSSACNLQDAANRYLSILDEGPQAAGCMGQGYICFSCGHCGIEPEGIQPPSKDGKACFCLKCKDNLNTNFVQLVLPNGQRLPWMERA